LGLGFGHLVSVFFLFEMVGGDFLVAVKHAHDGKLAIADTKENHALPVRNTANPNAVSAS